MSPSQPRCLPTSNVSKVVTTLLTYNTTYLPMKTMRLTRGISPHSSMNSPWNVWCTPWKRIRFGLGWQECGTDYYYNDLPSYPATYLPWLHTPPRPCSTLSPLSIYITVPAYWAHLEEELARVPMHCEDAFHPVDVWPSLL